MLSINDLSEAVEAYSEGSASLDEFSDWFHRASRGFWGESPEVRNFCVAIRAAFDALDYDGITEDVFRTKLGRLEFVTAARPLSEVVVSLSVRALSLSPIPVQAVYLVYLDADHRIDARIVLGSSMRAERIPPVGDAVRNPRTIPVMKPVQLGYAVS